MLVAVRERLERLRRSDDNGSDQRSARIRAVAVDAAPRWVEPYRTADHGTLLYDEAGLPR